jgi:hypothetical protein
VGFGDRVADARLEHLVDLDPESRPVFGGCDEGAVLDTDHLQFLHREKPFRAFVSAQGCHGVGPASGNTAGAPRVVHSTGTDGSGMVC